MSYHSAFMCALQLDINTLALTRAFGLYAHAYPADNNSYPFFSALGDLLLTGPPNTNVNDVILLAEW